jgi:hypothetical protein
MDVFLTQVEYTQLPVILAYLDPIFKFAFGISYEYQTIKLNVLTTNGSLYKFSNNSSFYVIYIRSDVSSQLLTLYYLCIIKYRVTIISCIIIIYLIKPNNDEKTPAAFN